MYKRQGYTRSDYFNPLYCNIVALSGLLASFLGLFFLRKSLLKLVSPGVTFWVIVSVFFGTNLYYYATREMNIAHVYNFFLFSLLLYMIPGYLKKPGRLNSFLLGTVLGWIILIRPTNIIVALLIPLYDVYSLSDLKAVSYTHLDVYKRQEWRCAGTCIAGGVVVSISYQITWLLSLIHI